MQTHPRTRMEIWLEAPLLKRAEELLDKASVSVYAVFDGREGKGLSGAWSDAGLKDVHDMRLVVAIAPPDKVDGLCRAFTDLFKRYPGVIVLSEVQVIRPERF
ncbi:MAG: hypothetical protein KGS44_01785 [Alphaproteobacteria bacterium]|jgi:hypothetical protein|nr:hypothetical protein [Alphaproteobacteria bacterium]